MNTLDEVIIGIREQMGFGDPILIDALHYLKEFQGLSKMWNDKIDKEQENKPLDWETLKQMEGKPVLVVVDGKERWRIIREVTNEHLILESGLPLHKCWMNHPDGWQAYRKERS